MPYAMQYDVPGTEEIYRQVNELIGPEPPGGLVAHVVVHVEAGLRHIEVWDSAEDWQRFHDERVQPALHEVLAGIGFTEMPPDPPIEQLRLVDIQLGPAGSVPA